MNGIRWISFFLGSLALVGLLGCTPNYAKLVKALASDPASFCLSTDTRGGIGGVAAGASAGYGQTSLLLCRSQIPDAKMAILPDGTIVISHGRTPN